MVEKETTKKQARQSSSSVLEDVSTDMVESEEQQKKSDERKLELEEKGFLKRCARCSKLPSYPTLHSVKTH